MSSEFEKEKRSKRIHDEETNIKRQVKIAKSHGLTEKDKTIKEAHRLSKHHAMNCGTPGCIFCSNPRHNKLFKDRKSTRLNSSHIPLSRMPSSA